METVMPWFRTLADPARRLLGPPLGRLHDTLDRVGGRLREAIAAAVARAAAGAVREAVATLLADPDGRLNSPLPPDDRRPGLLGAPGRPRRPPESPPAARRPPAGPAGCPGPAALAPRPPGPRPGRPPGPGGRPRRGLGRPRGPGRRRGAQRVRAGLAGPPCRPAGPDAGRRQTP